MSNTPTRYSAGGRLQAREGEDYSQYTNMGGTIVYWVDNDGVAWAEDFFTTDGLSVRQLKQQLDSLSISGLPSTIDCGTF